MLNSIHIKGFKCFDSVQLMLKNLTLLTGVNSSGKSSFIQSILLLMQQKDKGKSPINGKFVHLGLMREIKNWNTNPKNIQIQANHIQYIKDRMNQMLSHNTGKPLEIVEKDTDRDNYMTAQEAKEYGIIDEIFVSRDKKA